MAEIEHPQIYLISPPEVELSRFPKLLGECLDAVPAMRPYFPGIS